MAGEPPISPSTMPAIASVDERFLSYNVEMAEVVGGTFWKSYSRLSRAASPAAPGGASGTSAATVVPQLKIGEGSALFETRPPVDLSNRRLRTPAAALGPAYVRVSGTWANSVYFDDREGPSPAKPPVGFRSVLTRAQWQGVVDFARAVNAEIVTFFAISPGVGDAAGVWMPEQARRFLEYTTSVGGKIAAAELAILAPMDVLIVPPDMASLPVVDGGPSSMPSATPES